VASAEPEVIVDELTAFSGPMSVRDARHPERFSGAIMTNRLRMEGTDHLLAAGRAVGARRFVAQSFGAFRWARTGRPVLTEAEPLDPNPPASLRTVVDGLLYLERAVTNIEWGEGLVLRYLAFYGRGTSITLAADAVMARSASARLPIVGDGGGVFTDPHRRRRRSDRAIAAEHGQPASTTLSTTSPRPGVSGCRGSQARGMPSHQGGSHAGSGCWPPVRRQRSR
jgi:hypothetical protein